MRGLYRYSLLFCITFPVLLYLWRQAARDRYTWWMWSTRPTRTSTRKCFLQRISSVTWSFFVVTEKIEPANGSVLNKSMFSEFGTNRCFVSFEQIDVFWVLSKSMFSEFWTNRCFLSFMHTRKIRRAWKLLFEKLPTSEVRNIWDRGFLTLVGTHWSRRVIDMYVQSMGPVLAASMWSNTEYQSPTWTWAGSKFYQARELERLPRASI